MSPAVLVNVDDNEVARYARSRLLKQAGFIVYDAGTGGDTLRLMDSVKPDLVLLDVHLPDLNGIEVCRRIKEDQQRSAVIVLQISASAITAPQATAALNNGADSYLVEPVDPDVLVATVRALLRLRAAERALASANQQLSEKNVELKKVNEALRRSNEDLEHFAYVASHDLQEPLRNITTHLELLDRLGRERFTEAERELFSFVRESSQRMSLLIRDVLAYSRLGKDGVELKPTRIQEAVAWAVENLSESIAGSGAEVTAGDLPVVSGDLLQLGQVFQNLIGNSIKYRSSDLPPSVQITSEQDHDGKWVIRVRDNGIGIAEDYLEAVFRPFKRLHGYEIPGTGIGLALCRRIIEGHGGRLWAESRLGEGTTVLFTLRPASS